MPRPKSFPPSIYLGMTKDGTLHIIPENDPLGYVSDFLIARTARYGQDILDKQVPKRKHAPKKAPEAPTPSQAPAMLGIHPDKPPQGQRKAKIEPLRGKDGHELGSKPSSDGFGPPLTD